MIVCIPGPWKDHRDLVRSVAATTAGEFMFLGGLLAHPSGKDHVELEVFERYPGMEDAFRFAGQGQISEETLAAVAAHQSVAYLHFPLDLAGQRARLVKFTKAIQRCGGIAVKLETCGIAHTWERWLGLLQSDNPFDYYCAGVTLVGDENHFYSCGMHHFGLPDCQLTNSFDPATGADLMNRFNFYQIVEQPELAAGHTFSLTADSPRFRLDQIPDPRFDEDDPFHNPHGLWDLVPF